MKKSELKNFSLTMLGNGNYKITYKHPVTRKSWAMVTRDTNYVEILTESEPLGKELYLILMAIKAYNRNDAYEMRRAVYKHFCSMDSETLAELAISLMTRFGLTETLFEYYAENLISE